MVAKASEAVDTGPPVVMTGGSGGPWGGPPSPGTAAAAVGHASAVGTVVYAPQPIVDDPPTAVVGSKGTATPPQLQ